jgi:hypothetical protein
MLPLYAILNAAVLLVVGVTPLTTQPSTQPTTQSVAWIEVTRVEGIVQVRDREGQAWRKAQVGDRLTLDAEFRTGPRSVVTFTAGEHGSVELDRLGVVSVKRAIRDKDQVSTDLGMRYGRTRYDIEGSVSPHPPVRQSDPNLGIGKHHLYNDDAKPYTLRKFQWSLTEILGGRIFTALSATPPPPTQPHN